MGAKTLSDREVVEEALSVLLRHMEPGKVARFLVAWQADGEDYLDVRDRLFAGATVGDLARRVREHEARRQASSGPP